MSHGPACKRGGVVGAKLDSWCVVGGLLVGGSTVLLVGHKGSVDVCTRMLLGKPPRLAHRFRHLVKHVPYCAVASCREVTTPECDNNDAKHWQLADPGFPNFTHKGNPEYCWDIWK